MKADNFELVIKGWQLIRRKTMLKNIPVEAKVSHDQVDWLSSFEEELIQIQKDLNFYDNILKKFTTEDIVSLRLDFRNSII